jgi:hypothetical protein
LEQDKRKYNQELQNIEEKYKEANAVLVSSKMPDPGFNLEFGKQMDKLVLRILNFKNQEAWEDRITELETYKNDIHLNSELLDLERLIDSLEDLEKEVLSWRKRITPTSGEWKNRQKIVKMKT